MGHHRFERVMKLPVQGGFTAGIYVVRSKRSGNKYIEKTYPSKIIKSGLAQLVMTILEKLKGHPGTTQVIDSEVGGQSASLYMEYCERGTLADLVEACRRRNEVVREKFIWNVFKQLTSALAYCHYGVRPHSRTAQHGWDSIMHRDLKLDNVFLTDHSGTGRCPRIVLGDFGLACADSMARRGVDPLEACEGAPGWQVVPDYPTYDTRSDVWKLAAVKECLICLTGQLNPVRRIKTGRDKLNGLSTICSALSMTRVRRPPSPAQTFRRGIPSAPVSGAAGQRWP